VIFKNQLKKRLYLLTGPFIDGGNLRGIFVFNVKTMEAAEKLTANDPAVKSGSLVMKLHPWYGSAALIAIPEPHNKNPKTIYK